MDEIKVKVNSYGENRPLSLVWFDPLSGKKKAKSSGTRDWREAERLAGELERELLSGAYAPPSKITWKEFRQRFTREHLAAKAPATVSRYDVALNALEQRMDPDKLIRVNSAYMSEFQSRLRSGDPSKEVAPMKETTIATTLRHVQAALNWAVSMGMLAKAPDIRKPKRAKGQTMMRGRPITAEEFDRLLAAVKKVRPDEVLAWQRILKGFWLSGLRLSEAVALSWDEDAPLFVDLSGRRPALRIYAEAQKARRDEILPLTPDFAEYLMETPENEREGPVFPMPLHNGEPITARHIGVIIRRIGKAAGVVVSKAENKFASAHDLRRAFGSRWAKRVMPALLQKLMRHASIATTMTYYVALSADDMADELWSGWGADEQSELPPGNRNGNNALSDGVLLHPCNGR